jgi:anti-anti-sigma factor
MITERPVTRLTRDTDCVWVLELPGTADQEVFRQMTDVEIPAILKILGQTEVRKLIIDLAAIRIFDSQELRFLCWMYSQLAERNVPIILRNPSAHLRQILRIMQYDQIFKVETER